MKTVLGVRKRSKIEDQGEDDQDSRTEKIGARGTVRIGDSMTREM